jgi:hypothetical protein
MESLPLASPYPWTDSETQASRFLIKKRKGSGLSYLDNHKILRSFDTKRILETLLIPEYQETHDTNHLQTSVFYDSATIPQVAPDDATDATIMNMAQDGGLSLLLSILKLAGGADSTPTKSFIRHCALTVNPSTVPGTLDAKDMVLAALAMLSSDATLDGVTSSDGEDNGTTTTITLPLIEAENPHEDPEKRIYHKVGNWSSYRDFQIPALQELEVWLLACHPTTRERFVPRHVPDELQLLQKGIIPPSALPKRKGPAPGYRRNKAATAAIP